MWLESLLWSHLLTFLLVPLLHSLWCLRWLLLLLKILVLQISTQLTSPLLCLFWNVIFSMRSSIRLPHLKHAHFPCPARLLLFFPSQFSISNRFYGLLTGYIYSVSVIALLKYKLPMGSNIRDFHSLAHPQQWELYLEQGRCSETFGAWTKNRNEASLCVTSSSHSYTILNLIDPSICTLFKRVGMDYLNILVIFQ